MVRSQVASPGRRIIRITALFYYVTKCPIPGPGGPAILGLVINIIVYVVVSLATKPPEEKHIAKFQGIFQPG
jgi:hypothetical protein